MKKIQLNNKSTIYTIGHSTHSIDSFFKMLESFEIKTLADVRSFPASRRYPHFNKEQLSNELQKSGINYVHMKDLGGRRAVQPDSKNNRWRNNSFRGYADYMETTEFENAAEELETIALKHPTAYMCAEALWWKCHRSLISDYLKARDWNVQHIISEGKSEEHVFTQPAVVRGNCVVYYDDLLFDQ